MKEEFELEGRAYSRNKGDFKKILRKYGLKWKGSMNNFQWVGKSDKVTAYFDRDELRDVTLKARFVWEGKKKTDFLSDLIDWIKALEGRPAKRKRKLSKESKEKIQRELEFWDKIHQPPIERMKAEGRPKSWILKDIEDWKMRRKEKEKELKRKYA
ncbi:MAG: hypothetical protein ACE5QW_03475 [Thermoplasmata archaeon]